MISSLTREVALVLHSGREVDVREKKWRRAVEREYSG